MKKHELVEIIRAVVRQEIKTCLPQVLLELASKGATATISETKIKQPVPAQKIIQKRPSAPAAQVKPKTYVSNNPALNAILNETAGLTEFERSAGASTTPLNFSMESPNIDDYGISEDGDNFTVPSNVPDIRSMLPTHNTSGGTSDISPEEVPDEVAKALTRNYSGFMKKLDEKANKLRPV